MILRAREGASTRTRLLVSLGSNILPPSSGGGTRTRDPGIMREYVGSIDADHTRTAGVVHDETRMPLEKVKQLFAEAQIKDAQFVLANGLVREVRAVVIPQIVAGNSNRGVYTMCYAKFALLILVTACAALAGPTVRVTKLRPEPLEPRPADYDIRIYHENQPRCAFDLIATLSTDRKSTRLNSSHLGVS